MAGELRIEALAPEAPEVDLVSHWRHEALFSDWQSFAESDAQLHDWLTARAEWERLLLTHLDDRPVGTVWLRARELDARHELTPWLAVLYVEPGVRGRGIGAALVEATKKAARAAGFPRIHPYTYAAELHYARLGWRVLERFDHEGDTATLMSCDL